MRGFLSVACSLVLLGVWNTSSGQEVPIIQPGAPGDASRELTSEQAIDVADTSYSPADVEFMRGMIPHHQQALEMAELVEERTNQEDVVDIAARIIASQSDEMKFMLDWLADRGEEPADPHAHHRMHHASDDMNMPKMAGMATPEQMAALAAATGTEFDRQFLTLMIAHHEGAVEMVEDLLEQPGSAYDPVLFDFTSDITNDQTAEIERMHGLLVGLSDDPRAGLSAGFRDAGQAIRHLALLATLEKPAGFFDPANPAGLPPSVLQADEDDEQALAQGEALVADSEQEEAYIRPESSEARAPLLSFANTDMAFSGDTLIAGNYHGYNIYKLSDDGLPTLLSSIVCPGGQGDVSIVGDLLIMSVEQTRGRLDCGLQGVSEDVSADRFRGLRIFDISDLTRPVQVGAVQTCRGSHTHSVVSGPGRDGKIIVYNSGTSSVRDEEELAGCIGDIAGDSRTALFRIDVIEIPVDDPSKARIVDSPAVFADPQTGALAGLWRGGDHGDGTQETFVTNQCHDITVFPEAGIAAGACSGNGIIFDISNPRKPERIDQVVDRGFAYWHSATFNNDATKVIFTDEWGGGSRPRCRTYDPLDWGADAIYDIVDGKLEYRSYYKLPAPQLEQENCVAHNGSIIPIPGRDVFAQAWYQGGLSVVDFTDSANPYEIAFFDRGPINEEEMILGGYWSTYWYGGRIYATEIARGLDVFALQPSEYLSENEIAAAAMADQGQRFNPQQQFKVTWPAEPVVARAYIDQLARGAEPPAALLADIAAALDRAEQPLVDGSRDRKLSTTLRSLAKRARRGADDRTDGKRREALADTLVGIAARLR
ncbi:MAG: DUF305 domain-containing protein [Pseudomonadota bacterium]